MCNLINNNPSKLSSKLNVLQEYDEDSKKSSATSDDLNTRSHSFNDDESGSDTKSGQIFETY